MADNIPLFWASFASERPATWAMWKRLRNKICEAFQNVALTGKTTSVWTQAAGNPEGHLGEAMFLNKTWQSP
eukprot:scaffold4973_cov135-Cylindrotheca_fusiformis.AAC.8